MSRPRSSVLVGTLATSAVLTLTSLAPTPAPAADVRQAVQAPRPNVVFVLADDLGWSDISTGLTNDGHPSTVNDTPAIARLASEGVSFDDAYACLNCAPTRTALLTGLSAPRPDNNVYAVGGLNRGGDDVPLLAPPQGRADGVPVLGNESTTIGETLQRAGYATGYAGKFQVTRDAAAITAQHGFDVNDGGSPAGAASAYHAIDGRFNDSIGPALDEFAGDYTQRYVDTQLKPFATGQRASSLDALVGTDKHVSDALADAAIDFIDDHDERPFLSVVSTYAVHSPVGESQARKDLLAKYEARKRASGTQGGPSAGYSALVEGLDQSVARIVDHLETTADPRNPGHVLADNTVVVFTSDNGGRTDLGASNGPLRGQKGELTEGGVRVPWIAWSKNPSLVDGGTVNHSVIDSTDVYPTLAAWARTPLPSGIPFDGTDLGGVIARGGTIDRPRFSHLPGYLSGGTRDQRPQSWVRDGDYKAVYSYEDQSWRLYDLAVDPGETTDLSTRQPRRLAQVGGLLVDWLDSMDAPLATLKEGQKPLRIAASGVVYSDDRVRSYANGTTITVRPGDEVPLVLPAP